MYGSQDETRPALDQFHDSSRVVLLLKISTFDFVPKSMKVCKRLQKRLESMQKRAKVPKAVKVSQKLKKSSKS